jgi:outer membrane protein OmpA-like peptidoglycan-associated protein
MNNRLRLSIIMLYLIAAFAVAAAQLPSAMSLPQVPLREGLTIVEAEHVSGRGDYEPITTVTNADPSTVTLTLSTNQPTRCAGQVGGLGSRRSVTRRTVLRDDLERAHSFRPGFKLCAFEPDLARGSTAISVSASVLQELKAKGQTKLSRWGRNNTKEFPGVLTRVESGSVPFKVIVNDEQVELSVVHARWHSSSNDSEYWILDDVSNPLVLRLSDNGEVSLEVVKLSFPTGDTAARLQRDLSNDGRTVVYGIYFDFGSDGIKDESNAVLADIAKMLRQNPDWSLAIEGHTDNLGGDAYNVDLAKRRATAVKDALVTRYKIDGNRLYPAGFGATKPKDTNDTVEGRALNRRVELVRIDP